MAALAAGSRTTYTPAPGLSATVWLGPESTLASSVAAPCEPRPAGNPTPPSIRAPGPEQADGNNHGKDRQHHPVTHSNLPDTAQTIRKPAVADSALWLTGS
jgi:hypothetical protein